MNNKTKCFLYLAIVAIAVVGFGRVWRHGVPASAETQVRYLLAHAGQSDFAPLPRSATNFAYYQWNGLFTGETYARVQMSSNDLKSFITNSWELSATKPKEIFTAAHQHLPQSERSVTEGDHSYYFERTSAPDWFKPTIHGNGKAYFLWPDKYLYIDEDRGIVWVHFIKG